MTRASTFRIAGLLIPVVTACVSGAHAAEVTEPWAVAAGEASRLADEANTSSAGRLSGVVTDSAGAPLEETLITATGPAGTALAVCDSEGRFEFRPLAPGVYLLRTHLAGFSALRRHVVQVTSGQAIVRRVALQRDTVGSAGPTARRAGFAIVPGGRLLDLLGVEVSAAQPSDARVEDEELTSRPAVGGSGRPPHDDSEKAWRLRRARRSVLKSARHPLAPDGTEINVRVTDPRSRFALASADTLPRTDLAGGFPLSGQFHLLTRANLDASMDPLSPDVLPGQVAYVALGGPERNNRWGMKGAVTAGDAGSFVLAGTHVAELGSSHTITVGGSYSRQDTRHGTGVDADVTALVPVTGGSEEFRPIEEVEGLSQSREVVSLSADGRWVASSKLRVDYGLNVARYGYLEQDALHSPRATMTFTPVAKTRVRVATAQQMLAPGAEEFLPPSRDVWLPPERTFAPLTADGPLRAERARYVAVAVERDLGRSTVGVRRFAQSVDDQMITMFGVRPDAALPSSDHYYLANANRVVLDGWGVVFAHEISGRVRGSVDYSVAQADWAPWSLSGLTPTTVGILRTGAERFHDLTTSVEVEIPETSTRVLALHRMNSAFSVAEPGGSGLTSGLGARFAVRVHQTLPFSPIEGSEWEVLFDVRSLFRESAVGASFYDELFVVRPPKQVVGGLVVHF